MKTDCEIIRDLLPLYVDDICSDKSRKMVDEHLQECPACGDLLQKLRRTEIETNLKEEKQDVISYGIRQFKKLSAAEMPVQDNISRKGSGLKAMMEMELDFINVTMNSDSKDDIIFYSDMPMGEMVKNKEFVKKWIYGTALMLKKGIHMNIIHDVSRPFEEMMVGLESYLPMYMTGQISPYYLKKSQSEVFSHLIKVSGGAVLSGEAITGHHADGRYYLTSSREELRYYRKRAHQLLELASPLMDIYDVNHRSGFDSFFRDAFNITGERKIICGSLPVVTLSGELCSKLFEQNNISSADADNISRFIRNYKNSFKQLLEREKIILEIPLLTKEQYEEIPLTVSLSEIALR